MLMDNIFDKPAGKDAFYLRSEIEPKIYDLLKEKHLELLAEIRQAGYDVMKQSYNYDDVARAVFEATLVIDTEWQIGKDLAEK